VKRGANNKNSGVKSEKVVKNNKRKNLLRQDKFGALDESRGPNPITA